MFFIAPRAHFLGRDKQMAMAEAAHVIRFGDAEGAVETPIKADQLLVRRRVADDGADLWRTANRIQENAIRGGLSAWGRDANNRSRRVTTREVKGIDADVKINRALRLLSERMAAIKAASPQAARRSAGQAVARKGRILGVKHSAGSGLRTLNRGRWVG